MRVTISASDLDAIKTDLRLAHPEAKASLRVEAAARALGYNTYGGLRAALEQGALDVEADDARYREFLDLPAETANGWAVRPLGHALARIELRKVLDEHSSLTCRGFDSIWMDDHNERSKSIGERKALLAERRREAYEDAWSANQFELAWIYLSRQDRIATINRQIGSYGLKHRAEGLSRNFDLFKHLGNYVSNGMLIAAAYAHGFTVKPIAHDNYNAYFNISMRTVKVTHGRDGEQLRENRQHIARMYGAIADRIAA